MASSSKQPNPLPELVRDSQLETKFASKRRTVHIFHDTPTVTREEVWERDKNPIGRGAFGEVWVEKCIKGQEPGGPETRAVKVMRFFRHGEVRLEVSDYARELEALAKFSQRKYSRCFVKSYGWFLGQDVLCVGLEYLSLGDLRGYLSTQGGQIPQGEVQQIVSQLLDGLRLMHVEGFTHRDLKPANVLIKDCPPSGSWWVVLSDFGLTKRVESTKAGSFGLMGTPGYMAPELYGFFARQVQSIDYSAADIWCIGEMTFQMITGQPTFAFHATLFSYARGECEFPTHKLTDCDFMVDLRAINFITALMLANPAGRLDVAAATSHPWIVDAVEVKGKTRPDLEVPLEEGAEWVSLASSSPPPSAKVDSKSGAWTSLVSYGEGQSNQNLARSSTADSQTLRQAIPVTIAEGAAADNVSQAKERHRETSESVFRDGGSLLDVDSVLPHAEVFKNPSSPHGPPTTIEHQLKILIDRGQVSRESEVLCSSDLTELINVSSEGKPSLSRNSFLEAELDTPYLGGMSHLVLSGGNFGIVVAQGVRSMDIWNLNEGVRQRHDHEDKGHQRSPRAHSGVDDVSKPDSFQSGYPGCVVLSPEHSSVVFTFWPDPVIYTRRFPTSAQDIGVEYLKGHRGPITCLAFAPDYSLLASASVDGSVRIWDLTKSPKGLAPESAHVLKHASPVRCVGFVCKPAAGNEDHDSYQVLSWAGDEEFKLWGFTTHKLRLLGFSSSWKSVNTARLFLKQRLQEVLPGNPKLTTAAMSNNGRFLAMGLLPDRHDKGSHVVRLWARGVGPYFVAFEEQTSHFRLKPLQGPVRAIAFFGDKEDEFVALNSDNAVTIWDIATTLPVLKITKSEFSSLPISVLPGSLVFAVQYITRSVGIWNGKRIKELHRLQYHLDNAFFCAVSPNREWAASVVGFSYRGKLSSPEQLPMPPSSIMIWDVHNASPHILIWVFNSPLKILAVGFSADSERIGCVTEEPELRIWSVKTGRFLGVTQFNHGVIVEGNYRPPDSYVPCAALNSDLTAFACSHRACNVPGRDPRIYNPVYAICVTYRTNSSEVDPPVSGNTPSLWLGSGRVQPEEDVVSLAFSSDGLFIAEISKAGIVTVWDTNGPDGRQIKARIRSKLGRYEDGRVQWHENARVAFSPDNSKLALFSESGLRAVQVWSLAGSNPSLIFDTKDRIFVRPNRFFDPTGHLECHPPEFISPDWTRCVTYMSQSTPPMTRLWNLATSEEIKPLDAWPGYRNQKLEGGVSFSLDSKILITNVSNQSASQLRVWDAGSGKLRSKFKIDRDTERIFLWPDSKRVALTSSTTRQVRILDIETGEYIRFYEGHTGNYVV